MEEKPCIDPNQQPSERQSYPLEIQRKKEVCEENDKRYLKAGMSISEYNLDKESGVLDLIRQMPYGDDYLEDAETKKKATELDLWTRPAISWKLECEKDHPR